MTRRRRDRDRGSLAVETVVVVPALVALASAALVAGRISNSRGDVADAAQSAAREISIARTPSAATSQAEDLARSTLRVGEATCRSMEFSPTITPSEVTVEISCVVDLSAATMVPVPGHVTIQAAATEPIDQWRERGVP